jgi:hypothetical protein
MTFLFLLLDGRQLGKRTDVFLAISILGEFWDHYGYSYV